MITTCENQFFMLFLMTTITALGYWLGHRMASHSWANNSDSALTKKWRGKQYEVRCNDQL